MARWGVWRDSALDVQILSRKRKAAAMELRHLRYFVAVAEELHFRRAAERLYVAQPAVSEQIRKLEAELGVRLFDRTHRSVALTGPGQALLVEARRVLHQADLAQLAARNARDSAGARLRIGYVPDALPPSVPRALAHLTSAAPRVEVSLEAGATHSLIQAVRDQRLDAVVVGLPAPAKGLRATTLGHQPLIAALPLSDPRGLEPELTLEQLDPERLVMLPRDANPALHDAVLTLCRQAGLSPSFVEAAEPRVEAVLLAVAAGGGAALLPGAITERYAAPGVRLVELADAEPAFEVAVLTHPDAEHLATQAFLHAVARAAKVRPAEPAERLQVAA
jgi:DNA-binding transcriptional LysR family regulator